MRHARVLTVAIIAFALLGGCTAVTLDLQASLTRAQAAQAQGLLTKTDPLPTCLQYFVGVAGPQGPTSVLQGPFAGVIDVATDLYIINAQVSGGGSTDQLDAMCAPVALKLLKNAGRRAPGL